LRGLSEGKTTQSSDYEGTPYQRVGTADESHRILDLKI
jgi:hypothetical protein